MTLLDAAPPRLDPAVDGRSRPARRSGRRGGRLGERLLHAYTWLILLWLVLPIIVMIVFGFNDRVGKRNNTWNGFTLRWWGELFAIPDLTTALVNSLTIALLSTAVATVLGTLMGLALGRHGFRGRGGVELLMFANIAAPEVVLGASLLSLFITMGVPRGYLTILIAHIMFTISYVAVVVRARLAGFDSSVEEAARDLGAGPLTTFRLVTLPLILPGVVSGALLAFAMSIDEYVITTFNAGSTLTFPLWVFGATRVGVPPQVNVMATIIFVVGVLLALGNALLLRRRRV
ncbi:MULTISPECIES: ABC transporter permease [Frankia]|uniref:Polyamine ABC-transporter integral membrane protein n=1 Tax=Frankia alni (strain DSM 45986 / CECT 9034 / ACN14a) TaxID=326424 RepID=Q0RAT2_FRAAA|nr:MULTISPECIES: ABC transporter permease [Frankia]CAJ65458.1 Polyamine ABC-transporter integral membrane protein [Frankia alni ACN14a]